MISLDDNQLDRLLTTSDKRAWVDITDLDKNLHIGQVYLRLSTRLMDKSMHNILDLSVLTIDEEFRNSGYGSATIKNILNIAQVRMPVYGVYVENVLSTQLATILVKKFKFHILTRQLPDRGYFKRVNYGLF